MTTGSAARDILGLALLCLQVWLVEGKITSVTTDDDVLIPYTKGHGPSHSHRHVRECQHIIHGSMTYETWPSSRNKTPPVAESTVFISQMPGSETRWVHGHMAVVHNPLMSVSVVEPGGLGGCKEDHRVTVQQTAEAAGCFYALNAGFFNTTTDGCLGNIVSDGKLVRDSGGVQNAQFGIRKDGSLVFGYLSQEDVLDQSNPFVQLVSGVMWLLRNGEVYINQSLKAECDEWVDQEVFRNFVDVLSGRTAVGHDAEGNLIMFHVDGQTNERGMNLWEVADFLKKNGVINAINLDGGGSSSFVINGTLASYPPDNCKSDSRWRCPRAVSTILCVHGGRCQPKSCSGHGECVNGLCRCHEGWQGAACDSVACHPADCEPHGACTADGCVCHAGWRGKMCSQECLPGYYGKGCKQTCICFNGASCNHIDGSCTCPPGFHGKFCQQVCPPGFYGPSCAKMCQCKDQCPCDPLTGSCASNTESTLHRAGQCLAEQMFTLWTQQEERSYKDNSYLTEQTWLLITVSLVLLLLIRVIVHFLRASRRWLLGTNSFKHIQLSNNNGEKPPAATIY